MSELSPSAQAVLDAFRSSHTGQGCLAAALRAVADGMSPDWTPMHCITYIRAIAAELVKQ
jgi:hypothetical protein